MEHFLVLGDIVKDYKFVANQNQFRMVNCRRQEAYGCGPYGDDILLGLTLFVRLGRDDDPNNSPKLALGVSALAFRLAKLELGVAKEQRMATLISLSARIHNVDAEVMVIRISFVLNSDCAELSYYLVYDSADDSLFMLPRRPSSCLPIYTTTPLKVKPRGQDKYSLVLMAESYGNDPVLCVWSPPPQPPADDPNQKCPWDIRRRIHVNAGPFEAHVVFSFKGNAVWGDLRKGMLYCDSSYLIHSERMEMPEAAHFRDLMLPEECRTTCDQFDDEDPMPVHRNMGCVGNAIWFVIIQPSVTCPGETTVKVWTVNFLSGQKWKLHREFRMQSLWKLESFKALELPKTVPEYPILSQHDDGAIYMFLREPYTGGEAYTQLVCIDLSSSSKVCVKSARRMIVPLMQRPVVMPPFFFDPSILCAP